MFFSSLSCCLALKFTSIKSYTMWVHIYIRGEAQRAWKGFKPQTSGLHVMQANHLAKGVPTSLSGHKPGEIIIQRHNDRGINCYTRIYTQIKSFF